MAKARTTKVKSTENCKMCLEPKPLVSSHLMPAFLYDYCRKGEHGPIRIGKGFVIPLVVGGNWHKSSDCSLESPFKAWVAGSNPAALTILQFIFH
jgi:hypothetical protein